MITPTSMELDQYLHNINSPIEKVITNEVTKDLFHLDYKPLINYLIGNIKGLLSLALLKERNYLSDTAYTLISFRHPTIIRAISKDDNLINCAEEVFSESNPTEIMLNRLSDIISYVFTLEPDKASSSCGYLYCLLKHPEIIGIRNLFIMLFSTHKIFTKAQEHLNKMNFPEFVSQELVQLNYKGCNISDYNNIVFLKTEALFKIIESGAKNPIFSSAYSDINIMNCLLQTFDAPSYVIDAQWAAISSIIPILPEEFLKFFIEPSMSIFLSLDKDIHRHHSCSLNVLTTCLKISTSFVNINFLADLFRYFIKFDKCSEFHISIRNFVIESLKYSEINCSVVIKFAPVLMIEAQLKEYGLIGYSAYPILSAIFDAVSNNKDLADSISEIDSFKDFASGYLKKYRVHLMEPYGGFEPSHQSKP
ncbi:hypothetical protein TRFO_21105 [Tritrichomonas foetus]|uniref:Uncharacterized protein n=1 Tax=Tritrichomonas foetus TaxID=1144522 RepID=A0A1J4KFM8_9EUKA|nr:hypothetical protein TRFO_21105 [Tritrichomonas foetus]|eukprot:OHT09826.1 hypothetical protein TRFO_21105 [Tritrichomonas foetus]